MVTLSAVGRAVFDAFQATKAGIEDQYDARRTTAQPAAESARPVVRDQNAALSLLTSSSTRMQADLESLKKDFQTRERPEAERSGRTSDDPFRRTLRSEPDEGRDGSISSAQAGGASPPSRVDPAFADGLKAYQRTLSSTAAPGGN